jgi:hypothetical protein
VLVSHCETFQFAQTNLFPVNGWKGKKMIGAGTIVWEARELHGAGKITYDGMIDMVSQ